MRTFCFFVSDSLGVSAERHRDRLPISCFVLRESIARPALMLPISSLIILPLIGAVAEMAGSCVFPYLLSSDKQPYTQTTNNPQNYFLIKLLIHFVAESLRGMATASSCNQARDRGIPRHLPSRIRYLTSIYWRPDATALM